MTEQFLRLERSPLRTESFVEIASPVGENVRLPSLAESRG